MVFLFLYIEFILKVCLCKYIYLYAFMDMWVGVVCARARGTILRSTIYFL